MTLTLKERIVITNILPSEGSFVKMTVKKDLLDKLRITQEEITKYNIESDGSLIKWDISKDSSKEFSLSTLEENLIIESLKSLDKEEKINDEMLEIYNKFIK